MYNKSIFTGELLTIRNEDIRRFVERVLDNVPEYFWSMPASTTGKYHPTYSLGEGGLVRHTKAAVSFALDLLSLEQNKDLSDRYRDHIIAALILHDTVKKGIPEGRYTKFDHPLEAVKLCREVFEQVDIPEQDVNLICDLIKTHMGQWITDYDGIDRLEKPQTEAQKFVHMCDYLASKKHVTVDIKL